MKETGSIKFNCTWIKDKPLSDGLIKTLNDWRDKLYLVGLMGVNEEGIGFGNISVRYQADSFIISGSGTGKFQTLTSEHYTLVSSFDLDANCLTAKGPVVASSESLTHAVIYKYCRNINAVMHIHHAALWKKLLETLPSTTNSVEYGTPAMAREVVRLLKETPLEQHKIFAMAGHDEGVVSFGNDLDEAGRVLFDKMDNILS
jgi:L-ribulose-5-phosphate 4-epimerase